MKKNLFHVLTGILVSCSSFAQWVNGGTQISNSPDEHHRAFVSAATNAGYYCVWMATDTTALGLSSIKLNAFNHNGAMLPGWTSGGNTISPAGDFYAPQLITSEDSGVIVAWYGYPDSSIRSNIYTQKYSLSGMALWNGGAPVQVSTGGTGYEHKYPLIVSDKHGGEFMVWNRWDSTLFPSTTDVFLQHLDSSGQVAASWNANGTGVATTAGIREYYPQLTFTPDQSSIYVAYAKGLIGNTSCLLNKFNASDGMLAAGWTASGVILSSGPNVYPEINHDLKLYSDAANNAVTFWLESRGTANGELYMQQVSPIGAPQLTAGGEYVAGNDALMNGIDYLEVQQDSDMNFLIAFNNLVNFNDVAAMRIKPDGTKMWYDSLITTGGYSAYPLAIPDGKRGMFIFYVNTHSPEKLYVLEINSVGVIDSGWLYPGATFGTFNNYDGFDPNYDMNAVETQTGEAVVAWNRKVSGLFQIFNCNVLSSGITCHADTSVSTGTQRLTEETASLKLYPNPAENQISVYYESTQSFRNLQLKIFDLSGKVVEEMKIIPIAENIFSVNHLSAGMYLYQVIGDSQILANGKLLKQ